MHLTDTDLISLLTCPIFWGILFVEMIWMDSLSRMFIELPSFRLRWKNLGLSDDDLRNLEKELLDDPKVGNVLQGTGGVRKMRFSFPYRGKSGSVRVIYVDFEVYERIYLITAFQKADQENLSKAERNDLKKLVEFLELELERNEKNEQIV